jgi:TPR repeat protein
MLKVMGKAGLANADQIRALLEKAYRLDEAVAVFALSKLVAHGMGKKPDRARAEALLKKACQAGQARACAGQGLNRMELEGLANRRRTMKLLEQGCQGGVPEACVALADMLSDSFDSSPDILKKTFGLYRRACWGGYAMGCVGLGEIYSNGLGMFMDRSQALAVHHYRTSCNALSQEACAWYGSLFLMGEGVERNQAHGIHLISDACAEGEKFGCYLMGNIHESGIGLEPDAAKAKFYWERACKLGYSGACKPSEKAK